MSDVQFSAGLDTQGFLRGIKQIEAAWHPQLRADLVMKRLVPISVLTAEEQAQLPLSAPERYLLSRVDGKRELEAIVRVAPLKEFEALTYFDRFIGQGWVTASEPSFQPRQR
jgi:hypothetical protein